ncbi:baseplate assembly protein [Bradyrhizobium sp. HKCCYLS2038]|uniref:baseplate assembly protein n=1 Tax=Bradyrhizobium sp. HKCCYLS2038 TaxID=3420764 RepID=UPI003EB7D6A5
MSVTSRFLAPDLTQLQPADLIEVIDSEAILAAQKAWILARWADIRVDRPDLPPLDTLGLETEPLTILLEAFAYRETLLRALVNDKARAVLIAYASGSDLDHLGALFGVVRAVLVPGSNPPVLESDDRFRRRIQLAPEAFSTVGPRGAYIFFALTLDPSIADAWAYSPRDGQVHVVVAGANGEGVSDAVLARLVDRFGREDTVPLTDVVTVRRAEMVRYSVAVSVSFPRGPDPVLIKGRVEQALRAYAAKRYRIGTDVYTSGLIAAAKVGGVESVALAAPAQDVICSDTQVPQLADLLITLNVSD